VASPLTPRFSPPWAPFPYPRSSLKEGCHPFRARRFLRTLICPALALNGKPSLFFDVRHGPLAPFRRKPWNTTLLYPAAPHSKSSPLPFPFPLDTFPPPPDARDATIERSTAWPLGRRMLAFGVCLMRCTLFPFPRFSAFFVAHNVATRKQGTSLKTCGRLFRRYVQVIPPSIGERA